MNSQSIPLPPLRWLLVPVAGLALVATVVHTVRRRARLPAVRPMSDEWLREYGASRADRSPS